MDNWIDTEFDGSSLSPDDQQNFRQAMGKYKSKDEALIGGYNAIKLTGKPFKLPESLDKLPENVRGEFKTQAMKVLGVEQGVTNDSIKQVNFKKGLADGKDANETVVSKLTELAVKKGLTLSQAQDLVEMMNTTGTELVNAAKAEQDKTLKEAFENSNKVLTQYYGADKLKENAELLRRAMKDHAGLSNDEYEQIADDLLDNGYIFKKPALAKVLMDKIAPLAKEGDTTAKGPKGPPPGKRTLKDEGFTKTAERLGLE
jgi:hypothetical protein